MTKAPALANGALSRTVCRPFDKPEAGKIAVKIMYDLCDEVMKVFDV